MLHDQSLLDTRLVKVVRIGVHNGERVIIGSDFIIHSLIIDQFVVEGGNVEDFNGHSQYSEHLVGAISG